MSGGGGKGGSDVTETKLPKSVEKEAKANMKLAEAVGRLPYAPNFGNTFAAFTPAQEAAFANTDAAAGAFGMAGSGGSTGLPAPTNVGGFRGYSTQPLYEDAMSKVDPKILAMYKAFFGPQKAQAQSQSDPAMSAGKGGEQKGYANTGGGKGGTAY